MLYHVRHSTAYDYDAEVSLSQHLARLTAREDARQRRLFHAIDAAPSPSARSAHSDHFGNLATFLSFERPHRRLEITSENVVEVSEFATVEAAATPDWEVLRDCFAEPGEGWPGEACEFVFPSPLIPRRADFAGYAEGSFEPGRPVLLCAEDFMRRMHADFVFDARATTVATPIQVFFKSRRGVCQDFAHLMIAGLRSMGIPARYVSGYIETQPPPGQTKLAGADASHAWISVWCGPAGWVDLDPTNDLRVGVRHIVTAVGRDYSDVSPVRGVSVGSGDHRLSFGVDVIPIDSMESFMSRRVNA